MSQTLFASNSNPSLTVLDQMLTQLYALRELISDPGYSAATPKGTINAAGGMTWAAPSSGVCLQLGGSLARTAPVSTTTSYTVGDNDVDIMVNGTASVTLTLPAAASNQGRELYIKTTAAFTVVSATSNVNPLAGGAAGTAILAATAGKWVRLVSNGSTWVAMAGN